MGLKIVLSYVVILTNIFSTAYSAGLLDLPVTLINLPSNDKVCNNGTYNFIQFVAQKGYTAEEHTVTTYDEYILTVFRVYKGDKYVETNKTASVLLVHGILQDAGCWVDSGVNAGLAYNLTNEGYDVWLGNSRGNGYSLNHILLNAYNDFRYWLYSADEIARYDLTAMFDYVLNKTGESNMNYIGFSQGATIGLMLCSEKPEYCSKLNVFIALSPATTFQHTTSTLKPLVEGIDTLQSTLNTAGVYHLFLNDSLLTQVNVGLSNIFLTRPISCLPLIRALDSPHPGSITVSAYNNICPHFPAPIGVRNLAGYGKISKAGKFQKYDFGTEENLIRYGTAEPPEYNMTSVLVPVVIGQGPNDLLVAAQDTEVLANQLPNLEERLVVDDLLWNHLDMTNSQYGVEKLWPTIHKYLLKYSTTNDS